MIGFELSREQREIQEKARQFAEEVIKPVAGDYDRREELPWEIIRKAHAANLMNLDIPEEYGGGGLDHLTTAIVTEEISAGCAAVATIIGANSLATTPIMLAGTEEQKKKHLGFLCESPRLAAFCLTEPNAGSDFGSMSTAARRVGDEYILNGTKCFITNGGIADLYTVFATTDKSRGERGISAFIVPGDTPGLRGGKKEQKLGIRASHTAEVILEEVRVPKENLLGREGHGFRIAMHTLDVTRPGVGATALGVARAALELAVRYSKERVQFGKPISAHQGIQMMLADMGIEVEAARLLVWKAAWMLDRGLDATMEASMAKCFAGDLAVRASIMAVQILGGYGCIREYPAEKLMRDAKIMQIYEGTNQIQRMVVARALLKK